MADDNNKTFSSQKYFPITMGVANIAPDPSIMTPGKKAGEDGYVDPTSGRTGAQKSYAAGDGAKFKNALIDRTNTYIDAAAAYANNLQMVVSFYHVPSGKSVYFKAFITAFNETYSCDWGREAVFGRVDPIYLFKQTDKRISLALAVPAASDSEGYENLGKVQMLSQFLYPSYTDTGNALSIGQSPLVKIKVMDLLQNAQGSVDSNASAWAMMTDYKSSNEAESGQLGVINSLTVNHNLDRADAGVIERAPNTILPKHIELNLEFSPIHEGPLGWKDEKSQNELFPYGVSLFSGEMKKDQAGNPIIAAATPPAPNDADQDPADVWGDQSANDVPYPRRGEDGVIQWGDEAIIDGALAAKFAAIKGITIQDLNERDARRDAGHAMSDVWSTHGGPNAAARGTAGRLINVGGGGGSGAGGTMAPVMDVDFGGGDGR